MKNTFYAITIIFLVTSPAYAASKHKAVREGNRLYQKGDFPSSIEHYLNALTKDPENAVINFNAGTAFYKQEEFGKSIEHIQKALLSEDDAIKERAYYNLGNVLYRLGITQENLDINNAVFSLEKALSSYEGALNIDNKDEDAKYNYDFVKQELKRLREKQQKQRQQQDSKDKQNQTNQQNQNQQGNNQDNKNKQSEQNQQEQPRPQKEDQTLKDGDDEQDNQDGRTPQDKEREDKGKDSTGTARQAVSQDKLTKQEAEMLLNEYQQNEEPKELLNFATQQLNDKPVEKDW